MKLQRLQRGVPVNDITELDIFSLFGYSQGYLIWLHDVFPCVVAGQIAGSPAGCGYWRVSYDNKSYAVHRVIWTLKRGPIPEGFFVDHINGCIFDNRIENLRLATVQENRMNISDKDDRSNTGYRGIKLTKHGFRVKLSVDGDNLTLGTFSTLEAAIECRRKAKLRFYKEFARQ